MVTRYNRGVLSVRKARRTGQPTDKSAPELALSGGVFGRTDGRRTRKYGTNGPLALPRPQHGYRQLIGDEHRIDAPSGDPSCECDALMSTMVIVLCCDAHADASCDAEKAYHAVSSSDSR